MQKFVYLLALGIVGALPIAAQDVHGHLNVGAAGQKQNDKLLFSNGRDFATASEYVKLLSFTNATKYAGYYQGNITLTALHSFDAFGEPDPSAPAPGSFIRAEIVSVKGPDGGAFGFWETNSTTDPTFSIPTGTSGASYAFDLSEADLGAGQPGGDA